MFKNHQASYRRRQGLGVYGLVRLLLSLIVLLILGVGVYQAGKSFTGVDPLKLDPGSTLKQAINFQSLIGLLERFVAADLPSPLARLNPGFLKTGQQPAVIGAGGLAALSSPGLFSPPNTNSPLSFKFALLADSENDNQDLSRAIAQAKAAGVSFIMDLGDLSRVGTVGELGAVKTLFDESRLTYYVLPGDHDFWDSRNRGFPPPTDFNIVFGPNYQSLIYDKVGFVMVDNSDDYDGISPTEQGWIKDQLQLMQGRQQLIFVLSGTPFYHPSSNHVMGRVEPALKSQAEAMISLFNRYQVSEVMSGDTHLFSEYTEPETGLKMMTVGAITAERNLELPRYAIVDVYSDGSYNIEDIEIK